MFSSKECNATGLQGTFLTDVKAIGLRFFGAVCDFKSRDFTAISFYRWDCDFAIWASKIE